MDKKITEEPKLYSETPRTIPSVYHVSESVKSVERVAYMDRFHHDQLHVSDTNNMEVNNNKNDIANKLTIMIIITLFWQLHVTQYIFVVNTYRCMF